MDQRGSGFPRIVNARFDIGAVEMPPAMGGVRTQSSQGKVAGRDSVRRCLCLCTDNPINSKSQCAMQKNLAGFNRHFRFTRQNTFVRLSKTTAVQIQTLKTQQLKEDVYEKSKDCVHIGSARTCLLCRSIGSAGSSAANAHPDTDCHPATR